MSNFVEGIVENTYVGAEYEGVIWSRFLFLRVADGQLVRIFDPALLSSDLQIGETCKVIIFDSLVTTVQHFLERPSSTETTQWLGRIVSIDWHPPQIEYRAEHGLRNWQGGILVETSIGEIVIDTTNLKETAKVGGFVLWRPTRFDLLAVI